uniref:Alpha-galactosidase n=2 Tax=Eptatretus burgeri TaxID=7764 RepID=A0A8C4QU05_EPTBU
MWTLIICLALLPVLTTSLDNGVMRVPPMGWLAWERFRCETDCVRNPHTCISERLFMEMADRLVKDGWSHAGYKYVNIDDCWTEKKRNATTGRLVPDLKRFPNGIKPLADYIHSLGLKLGIYADLGNFTCGGYPGTTLDQIQLDAQTFAEWGVDMVKLDGCYSTPEERAIGYPKMSKALNKTGRVIAYSCSWPAYDGGLPPKVNYTLLGEICNLWRNYGDIQDSWDSVLNIVNWWGKYQDILIPAAGPGHWNDPDMLIVGDFSLSEGESRAQLAMWAILAAPLFMSNDLRRIGRTARALLQHPGPININQDPLGIQGRLFFSTASLDVWKRQLKGGRYAIAVLNKGTGGTPKKVELSLSSLNITTAQFYVITDVYEDKPLGLYKPNASFHFSVNPSDVLLLLVEPLSCKCKCKFVLKETCNVMEIRYGNALLEDVA